MKERKSGKLGCVSGPLLPPTIIIHLVDPDKCVRIVSNLRLKGVLALGFFSLSLTKGHYIYLEAIHTPKILYICGSYWERDGSLP
jgi:hypothetical protein